MTTVSKVVIIVLEENRTKFLMKGMKRNSVVTTGRNPGSLKTDNGLGLLLQISKQKNNVVVE